MSYQWPVDVDDLFVERHTQMVNTGLPIADVDATRAAITEMWTDAPGGWVHEWSALAARYAAADEPLLATLAYGWAKFPTLADDPKRVAFAHQLEQYQLAAPGFGVSFERRVLQLPYHGGHTDVAVHILAAPDLPMDAAVLLVSGGVDSWKIDLHSLFTVLAVVTRTRVVAFDIVGTGESSIPMTADGGEEMVRGLIAEARALGNGIVAHLGFSMGGYYSARSGLAGVVDAAVVLGGPVEAAFSRDAGSMQFGMDGIVGNALGFDCAPSDQDMTDKLASFSLRPLLDHDTNGAMLVINGADDVHVPQHDTLVFEDRRDTEVHLIPGTGHCAVSKLDEVVPLIAQWLQRTFKAVENAT